MRYNPFLILLILAIALSSCIGQDKEKDQENKSTKIISTLTPIPILTTVPIPTTVSAVPTTGITYEEQIRNNPPFPRNLTGIFKENYIELRWDIPEKIEIPHNYNDTIIHYNIYKGTRDDDIKYLTYAIEREFLDFNISDSQQYIYEITAVHEGNVESLPSEDVIVVK